MFDKFYASVKIAVSFIFVVFEMEKKNPLCSLSSCSYCTWAAPKARFRARRCCRNALHVVSHLSHFFVLSCARDSASQGCRHSLSFPARPAAALSSVSGNPFSTVRFIFSSTQPRLLASVHFLRGLAQSQLPAAGVTSEHTLESCACAHS